jgi:hypothetical protein
MSLPRSQCLRLSRNACCPRDHVRLIRRESRNRLAMVAQLLSVKLRSLEIVDDSALMALGGG